MTHEPQESPHDDVVEHDAAGRRFIVPTSAGTAELTYRRRNDGTLVLMHTEVPESMQGRGIARQLVQHALSFARGEQVKIVPACPYVRSYIEKHPEERDLVADPANQSSTEG